MRGPHGRGKWPGTERPLRIEAAAFEGKPVFFRLIGDWTEPPRMQAPAPSTGKKAGEIILLGLLMSVLVAAAWLARRNYRHGRGDKVGALRLAKVVFVCLIVLWVLRCHFVPELGTLGQMMLAISTALFLSSLIFVLYLALEPYVRRYWPHAIISWSRLLTGRIRDPLVGRDILFGVLLGVVWIVVFKVARVVAMRMGSSPELLSSEYLTSVRSGLGVWFAQIPQSIIGTLQFFLHVLDSKNRIQA